MMVPPCMHVACQPSMLPEWGLTATVPSSEQLAMYSTASSKQISFTADLWASMRFTWTTRQMHDLAVMRHAIYMHHILQNGRDPWLTSLPL